jgi:hypothetical protein
MGSYKLPRSDKLAGGDGFERVRSVCVYSGKDPDPAFADTSPRQTVSDKMNASAPLDEPLLSKEFFVSLRVIAGSLKAHSAGLSFQCDHDGKTINCGVASDVLRDLLAFHGLESSEDDAFRALLPEIERLAKAKCAAGRFEENGVLVIRAVDLLRYGFQAKSAA